MHVASSLSRIFKLVIIYEFKNEARNVFVAGNPSLRLFFLNSPCYGNVSGLFSYQLRGLDSSAGLRHPLY